MLLFLPPARRGPLAFPQDWCGGVRDQYFQDSMGFPMKHESREAKSLHEGRRFNYEAIEAYQKRYIDESTGFFAGSFTTERSCPACDSDHHVFMFSKAGGNYFRCIDCTMVFTNPIMLPKYLTEYYAALNTGQGIIVANESEFYTEIYSKGLKLVSASKRGKTLLDVGCSTGFFLDIARSAGWDTFGIEPGLEEGAEASRRGHKVFGESVDQLSIAERFDAITLWDVFEHIPEPHQFLESISQLLAPDGILYMQIPNSSGLAPRILHERCNMFDGLEHCNLYNPQTIRQVLEANGFSVLAMESVISEMAVLINYLEYEDPYFGSQSLDGSLLNVITEDEIHKNLLGYKLQLVAQML